MRESCKESLWKMGMTFSCKSASSVIRGESRKVEIADDIDLQYKSTSLVIEDGNNNLLHIQFEGRPIASIHTGAICCLRSSSKESHSAMSLCPYNFACSDHFVTCVESDW
jgi:hypothetical protein